jgi:hypothetical protein
MAAFFKKIGTGLSALNAVTDELSAVECANVENITFYIVGNAGVATGAVQPEESHLKGYTGTWAPIGSPITVAALTCKTAKALGPVQSLRARVSTVMGGGTVDVWVQGR